jgi:hypothetical protein
VTRHIIFPHQLLLQLLIQIVKRAPSIRKLRIPACSTRRQCVRPQEREPGPPWVERRVDVEERVALAKVVAFGVELGDGPVVLEVRDVEDLVVRKAVFAAQC